MVTAAICQAADEWSTLGEDLQRDGFVSLNHVTTIDDIQLIRHELMSLWDDQSEKKYQIRNLQAAFAREPIRATDLADFPVDFRSRGATKI